MVLALVMVLLLVAVLSLPRWTALRLDRRAAKPMQDFHGKNVTQLDVIRHRLIEWLARGDAVVLNTHMSTPQGWWLARQSLDTKALIANNMFDTIGGEPIPNTEVMSRVADA